MRVVVVEPPAPVVSWADAERHLRLDGDDAQQEELEAIVAAATGHIDGPDGWLGRALGMQTLELRLDHCDCAELITLPCPPVIELLSVTYLDPDKIEQTADLADFELLGRALVPAGDHWPWTRLSTRREAVRVRYRAGYAELPKPIRQAILLMVGDLYANRETVMVGVSAAATRIPMSTNAIDLLRPYRIYW